MAQIRARRFTPVSALGPGDCAVMLAAIHRVARAVIELLVSTHNGAESGFPQAGSAARVRPAHPACASAGRMKVQILPTGNKRLSGWACRARGLSAGLLPSRRQQAQQMRRRRTAPASTVNDGRETTSLVLLWLQACSSASCQNSLLYHAYPAVSIDTGLSDIFTA